MKEAITSLRFNPHSFQECYLPTTPDHCWWTQLLIMIRFPPTAQTFCCPNHPFSAKFNTFFFCLLWNTTWEIQWLTVMGQKSPFLWEHKRKKIQHLMEGLWGIRRVIFMAFPFSDFLSVKKTYIKKKVFWNPPSARRGWRNLWAEQNIAATSRDTFFLKKILFPMDPHLLYWCTS